MVSVSLSSLLKASCLALAALASATPGLESRQAAKNLRILPLGDSITFGFTSSTFNGYRFNLQTLLQNAGFEIDYIGDVRTGNMTDNQNEGLPGFTTNEIHLLGLGPLLGLLPLPNLVLLHTGTNDALQNHTPSQMITDLNSILNAIYKLAPNTTVVLSQIIMNKGAATQSIITQYNSQIPGVVTSFSNAGKRIVGVSQSNIDLNNGDGSPDTSDPTHPGDAGFVKMANNFFGGVQAAASKGLIAPALGPFTPAPHGK